MDIKLTLDNQVSTYDNVLIWHVLAAAGRDLRITIIEGMQVTSSYDMVVGHSTCSVFVEVRVTKHASARRRSGGFYFVKSPPMQLQKY